MGFINKVIEYLILVFIFLVPWQARWIIESGEINGGYWEYGTKSLYATEILLAVILVLLIIKWIVETAAVRRLKKDKTPQWGRLYKRMAARLLSLRGAVFLMVIWTGLSIFWAQDRGVALEHWMMLLEAVVVLFILLSNIVSSKKLFWAIILSAGLQAVLGIIQFLTQTIPASTWLGMSSQNAFSSGPAVIETGTDRWLRAYGTFPHPNILGGYLVLGILAIINKLKDARPPFKRHRVFLLTLFTLMSLGLLMTFSRSAWLAMLVAIVYYLLSAWLYNQFKFVALKIAAIMAAVVIAFCAIYPNLLLMRFDTAARLELKSLDERAQLTDNSLGLIKNHPLVGVGFGNYGLAVQREIVPNESVWYYQPVHNYFLLVWAELGIVGLAIVLYSLWFMAFRYAFGFEARHISLFLLPAFVISLFDHYFWTLYPGLLILGLYIRLSNPEKIRPSYKD